MSAMYDIRRFLKPLRRLNKAGQQVPTRHNGAQDQDKGLTCDQGHGRQQEKAQEQPPSNENQTQQEAH